MKLLLKFFKGKGIGRYISLGVSVVSLVCLIAYTIYGTTYDYFDGVVFVCILIALAASLVYFIIQTDNKILGGIMYYMNLVAVVALAVAFSIFVSNSVYVWADELNGITMFESRGGLKPVIAIMVIFLVAIVAELVSCFLDTKDKVKEEKINEEQIKESL